MNQYRLNKKRQNDKVENMNAEGVIEIIKKDKI